jgi:6-phosphogluconolactonase
MVRRVCVYEDMDSLSLAAANLIFDEITKILRKKTNARIILAGGSTPKSCYAHLESMFETNNPSLGNIDWFPGDERWVPRDDPESNENMIRSSLFGNKNHQWGNFHSWNACEKSIHITAKTYGDCIKQLFGDPVTGPDVLVLGLGEDGHTASLFPDALVYDETGELTPLSPDSPGYAAAVYLPGKKKWRLTLTPRILNRSALVLFLASGRSKKEALTRLVFHGDRNLPSSWIRGERTLYMVTRDTMEKSFGDEEKYPVIIELSD